MTMVAPPVSDRTIVESVMRRSFALTDEFHHDSRSFRNRLVVTSLLALSTAFAILVVQWRLPKADIIQRPVGGEDVTRWALVILVMAFGAVGGLITSIPALAALPRVKGPFNFPLQQAFLKIALGSVTAVVGVIVTGSAGVTTGYASMQALAGVALVFGAAQQAVTQFLDKRAGQIIEGAA
ncbi:MAG TPA: hypothetical protein VHI95_19430 [Acidimicrobiales bacterium]|jgi:hypothetical protein|nr:hypothetical protein [Acidimicrobiales bacterium]